MYFFAHNHPGNKHTTKDYLDDCVFQTRSGTLFFHTGHSLMCVDSLLARRFAFSLALIVSASLIIHLDGSMVGRLR
jgi:hypothetical protein